jgi:hypothetical protein
MRSGRRVDQARTPAVFFKLETFTYNSVRHGMRNSWCATRHRPHLSLKSSPCSLRRRTRLCADWASRRLRFRLIIPRQLNQKCQGSRLYCSTCFSCAERCLSSDRLQFSDIQGTHRPRRRYQPVRGKRRTHCEQRDDSTIRPFGRSDRSSRWSWSFRHSFMGKAAKFPARLSSAPCCFQRKHSSGTVYENEILNQMKIQNRLVKMNKCCRPRGEAF